jgi:amino acid adenylation domain-containing protein
MPRPEPRLTNPFPLVRSSADRIFPLSAGQERLWWLQQVGSSYGQDHVSGGWRFPAGLDAAALSAAFAGLLRRHEILRSRFVLRADGTTAQEVVDDVRVAISWAGGDWPRAVERAVSDPFDLARPPLLRAVAAELDDGDGLFVAIHHIVSDRWSMDVLPRDLLELYEAALQARAPRLPELTVQYGDYARWQRQYLASDLLQPQLEYWRRALTGCERLELPLDRPRSAATDAAGSTVAVELSEEATAKLTAMAWRARASPVIVVTAALVEALSAFSGQPDVVMGAILSDRPHPELQDLIGFFVNTVVLRVDLSPPGLTFREVIARTRDAWLAADAHQDAPFEQIVGALGAGTDRQRNPVFDVAINHGGDRTALSETAGAPTPWSPEVPVITPFDVSLTTQIVDGRLRASFLYRPGLFDETTIAALASRYVRLLERGLAAPDRPLHELELVEESERERLHGYNDASPAPDATIVELVEAQAAVRPQAPAVIGADRVLSYQQLNERANQLARHLLARGAGPERVVGVCLERTVEMTVTLLAIAKSGAAYLPLDPGHPVERHRFLLSDTRAILTIASPALRDRVPRDCTPVLVLGGGEPDLTGCAVGNPPRAARPDNLAYLISTSGSTGTPKAVAISHRALSRFVAGAPGYLDVGPGTTLLQTAPLTFDVAVLEWAPLGHGGRVAVVDTGTLLEDLERVLRDHEVSTLMLVTPQLDLVVERDVRMLSSLRELAVAGDVVNPKSFAAARAALPGGRVLNAYGPTECTVLATAFGDEPWTGRVPIGRAIPHTSVYVLDRDHNLASTGMRGEIHLAGDGLARGYHGRPGLTAASFLPDPHGPSGARMYRTGDVGRYLAGGAVDFLGRADRQVKIRGFRIEAGEIEHVLLRQPGVESAVVVPVSLATGPALVAYVVASAPIDATALRRALRAAVPAYMVPDHLVQLPRLPLTPNRKVDRAALPPVAAAEPADGHGAPSAIGLEAHVLDAWSDVLGRRLRATEDFFEVGGHSLLVPRATARVRQVLGREVPLRLMMEARTPASYTAAILRESLADLGAATRERRLEQRTWRSRMIAGDRRVDLFVSAPNPAGGNERARPLVVLDGSEFVDIMRLPAILDRLVLSGAIPMTAAVFVSPVDWHARRRELLDEAFVDLLADELVPILQDWLGDRCAADRAVAIGASLGAVTAIRAALRRPDRFDGAVALSGPLTDHRLGAAAPADGPARFFLSAGREEADIVLDDGLSLLEANTRTAEDLAGRGHAVRCARGEGGHTYAAWEAMLPPAVCWMLTGGTRDADGL